jgi:uncharacterized protein
VTVNVGLRLSNDFERFAEDRWLPTDSDDHHSPPATKSSQNRLEKDGETYKAWVSAPPVDGAANEALIKLVAKHFGVAPSKVEIVRGHASRSKTIKVSKD